MTTSSLRTPPKAASGGAMGPPLFIVGCGRSGTTLLRLMFTAHPDLAIPQESHVMYRVARDVAAGRWPGTPARDRDWQRLLDRVATAPDLAHWDGFDAERLRERLGALAERTHGAVFRAMFEEYAAQRGGDRWGDKTPQHVQYMLVLDRLFPDARFLHVIRDGRDVALSLLRMGWGPRRIGEAGYYWAWLVLSGRVAGRVLGPDRYREVRYEDVVTDPEAALRRLTAWAGLPYRADMLTYYDSDAARDYARLARERSGRETLRHPAVTPPDPGQLQKWRDRMAPDDLRSFLRQSGGLLRHLGYDVADLPPAQRRLEARLGALMEPGEIESLVGHVGPLGGPGIVRPPRLLAARGRQLAALVAGRERAFARESVRWQRTVASTLR